MDKEIKEKWFAMPIQMQISNIGSEVGRAIQWKNKGNEKRSEGFCQKAIDYLTLTIEDPKNVHRIGELIFCIRELQDYFLGSNYYGTTEEMLKKYYDAFIRHSKSETEVSRQRAGLDSEHGRKVCEVRFNVGRTEYEYDIDADTGEIVKLDIDLDD